MRERINRAMTEKRQRITVFFFFTTLFCTGIFLFQDYGISWDESISRHNGNLGLNYILHGDRELVTYNDRYYGPAFEMFLMGIEKLTGMEDSRVIYLMRHLMTFLLFFTGVFFFYLISFRYFNHRMKALLACFFLVLSPRIFAHAFYNSKDIAFLSVFIISIYTLWKFSEKRNIGSAAVHAVVCAILTDIRISGIMIPFFTVMFTFFLFLKKEYGNPVKPVLILCFYLVLTAGLIILFWPILWENPVYHFIQALKQMSHYNWDETVLYLGEYVRSVKLPWHYIPVWIAITTPVVYTICFLAGIIYVSRSFLTINRLTVQQQIYEWTISAWFFIPMFVIFLLKPVVYDEWRHFFFIYPPFIIFAVRGLGDTLHYLRTILKKSDYQTVSFFMVFTIAISCAYVFFFMVRFHPHQNVYFNILTGTNMDYTKQRFEMDYWGLSYRQALEYVVKHDQRDTIRVFVEHMPGKRNSDILPRSDRIRLNYVQDTSAADYFISNYRWHRDEFPYRNEYYSIYVYNTRIMVVYKDPKYKKKE